MQEMPISELTVPKLLAAVAQGEHVRLTDAEHRAVAVVTPPPEAGEEAQALSFAEAMAEFRRTHDIERNGVTFEEVDSWRDRSPGRESSL